MSFFDFGFFLEGTGTNGSLILKYLKTRVGST
jgi:hypothetical protein